VAASTPAVELQVDTRMEHLFICGGAFFSSGKVIRDRPEQWYRFQRQSSQSGRYKE
jgi:ATP-dependent protease Clp ATPase subunit